MRLGSWVRVLPRPFVQNVCAVAMRAVRSVGRLSLPGGNEGGNTVFVAAPLVRTSVPGIHRRGGRCVVTYRPHREVTQAVRGDDGRGQGPGGSEREARSSLRAGGRTVHVSRTEGTREHRVPVNAPVTTSLSRSARAPEVRCSRGARRCPVAHSDRRRRGRSEPPGSTRGRGRRRGPPVRRTRGRRAVRPADR